MVDEPGFDVVVVEAVVVVVVGELVVLVLVVVVVGVLVGVVVVGAVYVKVKATPEFANDASAPLPSVSTIPQTT